VAIGCIDQDDLSKLIAEFHDHALALIHDSHGNHVIQKCIQAQSFFAKTTESKGDHDGASKLMGRLQFIFDDVITHIESLSLHRFGCRVVQRCLEFGTKKQRSDILEAITACNEIIVGDMFGNYVVQQAIVTGGDVYRNSILQTLTQEDGSLCRLSKQKYASNVVERVLQHGSIKQKEFIVKELLKVRTVLFHVYFFCLTLTSIIQ
jgi:pumilio RNA-binding family